MYVFLCLYDFWSQRSLTLIWLLLLLLLLRFHRSFGPKEGVPKASVTQEVAGWLLRSDAPNSFHIFGSFWCFGFEEWMVHVTVPLNSGSCGCARGLVVWSQLDSKGRIESWLVSAFSKYRQRNVGKKCGKQWNKVVIRQCRRAVCPMCTLRKTIHVTVAG